MGKSSGVFGYLTGVLGYQMGVLGYLMGVLGYLMYVLGYLMVEKSIFGIGWGSGEVSRRERTDHTKLFSRTFSEFGFTWHQKVHFSTFDDGDLTMET